MPYIPTEEVESSNIERIGYLRKQQILRIIFQGGRAYDYPMVTERDFNDLMAAESKGSFFNRRIKPLYGHRTPRPVELVEPCCEHAKSNPTCTEECYPCNQWCCPAGAGNASPKQIAEAIADGLRFGGEDHSAAPVEAPPETPEKIAESIQVGGDVQLGHSVADEDADMAVGVAKVCLHPNIESLADGSNPVCAACGVDLSQSGDCPHGAAGRTCEEGCGCIPCHAPVPESPEA